MSRQCFPDQIHTPIFFMPSQTVGIPFFLPFFWMSQRMVTSRTLDKKVQLSKSSCSYIFTNTSERNYNSHNQVQTFIFLTVFFFLLDRLKTKFGAGLKPQMDVCAGWLCNNNIRQLCHCYQSMHLWNQTVSLDTKSKAKKINFFKYRNFLPLLPKCMS